MVLGGARCAVSSLKNVFVGAVHEPPVHQIARFALVSLFSSFDIQYSRGDYLNEFRRVVTI